MAQVLINDTTMIDIADAIREKIDIANQMLPSEMGGAIRGIDTGIKIPESIVAGETPVFVAILQNDSYDDAYREVVGLTIKKAGTYKFSICAGGTGGYGYLRKNGSNVHDFDNYGWTFITLNCQVGDRITLVTSDSTRASIMVYCLIVSIQWNIDSDFTSRFLVSSALEAITYETTMSATNIYIDIPKTATYKMMFRITGDSKAIAQLYKNGVAINGTKLTIGSSNLYSGNISCNAGDKITVYGEVYHSGDSMRIYQLSAEEIIN